MRVLMAFLIWSTALMFAGAAYGGFSRGSLVGAYGCLGKTSEVVSTSTIEGVSELMQLHFSASGSITGSMKFNRAGEVCKATLPAGSTFLVNPDGTGSMLLTLALTGRDADSDVSCSTFNAVTEHFDIIILGSGEKFEFVSSDPFFTLPHVTGDVADEASPFTGACERQIPP